MKKRWHYEEMPFDNPIEAIPVPIVADSAIARPDRADGRPVPIVILDTSKRPDIENIIKLHQHLPPGDVESQWGKFPKREDKVLLRLQYQKPSKCTILLEFDVENRGAVVDGIVGVQGLYIKAGRPGDTVFSKTEDSAVIIEVPSEVFQPEWDKIFHQATEKYWRKQGYSRQAAKLIARQHITDWRNGAQGFRMKYPDA